MNIPLRNRGILSKPPDGFFDEMLTHSADTVRWASVEDLGPAQ